MPSSHYLPLTQDSDDSKDTYPPPPPHPSISSRRSLLTSLLLAAILLVNLLCLAATTKYAGLVSAAVRARIDMRETRDLPRPNVYDGLVPG